jgi:hypothetical protein
MALIKCPVCAEEIQEEAKKCRYCNEWLNRTDTQVTNPQEQNGIGSWTAFVNAVGDAPQHPSSLEVQDSPPRHAINQNVSVETSHFNQTEFIEAPLDVQTHTPVPQSSSPIPVTPHVNQFGNDSGLGEYSILPPELDRANWTPLLGLSLFWCIAHRIWGGVLALLITYLFPLFTRFAVSKFGQTIFSHDDRAIFLSISTAMPILIFLTDLYLIIHGNKLAWKHRKWKDIPDFNRVQRIWVISSIRLILISIITSVITIILIPLVFSRM